MNKTDIVIEWMYDKIFDRKFNQDILELSWQQDILIKFNYNEDIIKIISDNTSKNINIVRDYLSNENYQINILKERLKKKHDDSEEQIQKYINIILNKFDDLLFNYNEFKYAIINNHELIVNRSIENLKFKHELLKFSVRLSNSSMYFLLRNGGLFPNYSILLEFSNYAQSFSILQDILKIIGPDDKVIENIFQFGNSETIICLIDDLRSKNKITNIIRKNIIAYILVNNNQQILEYLKDDILWHKDLYYSALLSGSESLCEFVESKIINVHENNNLDRSFTKKGRTNLIINEIKYLKNGNVYFSHVMNYAVLSDSLIIVERMYNLGYGITLSNIISALTKNNLSILKFLLDNYKQSLPFYLIHYVGITNYNDNKLEFARLLINHTNIINLKQNSTDDYKKEKFHLSMINNNILEDTIIDIDYYMNNILFFSNRYINYLLINNITLLLRLNIPINYEEYDIKKRQTICDVHFLLGNIEQIKSMIKYYDLVPNILIICELFCRYNINKLILLKSKLKDNVDKFKLKNIVEDLNDNILLKVYNILIE